MSPRAHVVDGIELVAEQAGSGCDLVWAHGLTSSRAGEDAWPIVDHGALAAGARVLRYDARGHGESGPAEPFSYARLAADQLALADAHGIDRYVVAGASLGTGTALEVAVTRPDRVVALVLVIPPTAWETRAPQREVYAQMAAIVAGRGVEPLIAAGASAPMPAPFDADAYRAHRAERLRAADPARLAALFGGAAHIDLPSKDAVAAIEAPTLILAWSGDPTHPVSTADELGELIDGSEVVVADTAAELHTWTDRIVDFVGGLG